MKCPNFWAFRFYMRRYIVAIRDFDEVKKHVLEGFQKHLQGCDVRLRNSSDCTLKEIEGSLSVLAIKLILEGYVRNYGDLIPEESELRKELMYLVPFRDEEDARWVQQIMRWRMEEERTPSDVIGTDTFMTDRLLAFLRHSRSRDGKPLNRPSVCYGDWLIDCIRESFQERVSTSECLDGEMITSPTDRLEQTRHFCVQLIEETIDVGDLHKFFDTHVDSDPRDMLTLIMRQWEGEKGVLILGGRANMFRIKGRLVYAYYVRGDSMWVIQEITDQRETFGSRYTQLVYPILID